MPWYYHVNIQSWIAVADDMIHRILVLSYFDTEKGCNILAIELMYIPWSRSISEPIELLGTESISKAAIPGLVNAEQLGDSGI